LSAGVRLPSSCSHFVPLLLTLPPLPLPQLRAIFATAKLCLVFFLEPQPPPPPLSHLSPREKFFFFTPFFFFHRVCLLRFPEGVYRELTLTTSPSGANPTDWPFPILFVHPPLWRTFWYTVFFLRPAPFFSFNLPPPISRRFFTRADPFASCCFFLSL